MGSLVSAGLAPKQEKAGLLAPPARVEKVRKTGCLASSLTQPQPLVSPLLMFTCRPSVRIYRSTGEVIRASTSERCERKGFVQATVQRTANEMGRQRNGPPNCSTGTVDARCRGVAGLWKVESNFVFIWIHGRMRNFLARTAGLLVGLGVLALRMTCCIRIHNDPRREVTAAGLPHVFATLHAHQIAGSMGADRGTGAMVSRSIDGEIIIPALLVGGHVPIRGSSGIRKGGASALHALIDHVQVDRPAMLACDGPRGPRGRVQKGIGLLARKSNATVLTVVSIPSRRWIFSRTWDRLQVPKPFSTIDIYFGEPLRLDPDGSLDEFTRKVQDNLLQLEASVDPHEASVDKPSSATLPKCEPRAAA